MSIFLRSNIPKWFSFKRDRPAGRPPRPAGRQTLFLQQKYKKELATFFSPWRSRCHQIQHLRLTLDRISGPVVHKIFPGARWATRRPNIKKEYRKIWGPTNGSRTQHRDVFLQMSGMALGSFLAYWGIIWGP